jgi:hypothetical protein
LACSLSAVRGRDGVDDLGLVARSALHHAACPVLDIPG